MKKILAISVATLLGLGAFAFAAKKAPAPVNDKCPVSGKAVNAEKTITVGFCCGKCCGKAAKILKAGGQGAKDLLAKVKADNKDGDTVNKVCPFSDKELGKPKLVVAFCCGNCQGKYTAK